MIVAGCHKEVIKESLRPEEEVASAANKHEGEGFTSNDMVLYWDQKVEYLLNRSSAINEFPFDQLNIPSYFFAIIQIAVYDALNSITPKYGCYALKNTREKGADPNAAVASAAYWTVKHFDLQVRADGELPIDDWYAESLASIPDGEAKDLGIALGKRSSDAIINARSNDNYYSAIQPTSAWGSQIGEYRATTPFATEGAQNYFFWNHNISPFSVVSFEQFLPNAPYAVNSDAYTNDYNEVKQIGNLQAISAHLNKQQ
jgi:hypothetical protein